MGKHTGTKTGRSESLLLRVPAPTKERLRIVADETGRTMTGEAQYRLERSLDQDEGRGGPQIAAMLDYMGSIAALIQSQPEDDAEEQLVRYWALRDALADTLKRYLPKPTVAPDYGQRRIAELEAELPALKAAAIAARLEQGAEDAPKLKRNSLFGSSAPLSLQSEPEFLATPPARALTQDSFARLQEWRRKPKEDQSLAGAGLLGNGLTAPLRERVISIRVEKTEDGLRVVGGAEDALRQEQQLGVRERAITEAEHEWARAHDELTVLESAFLDEIEKRKAEAERLASTALARIEVRYDLPHDELLEAITAEAEHRGVKTS